MKKQTFTTIVPMVCVVVFLSSKSDAAWNGIGVFGGTGLTAEQVARITAPGTSVKMMSDGYVRLMPTGTLMRIQ